MSEVKKIQRKLLFNSIAWLILLISSTALGFYLGMQFGMNAMDGFTDKAVLKVKKVGVIVEEEEAIMEIDMDNLKHYESEFLGIEFDYPSEWGEVWEPKYKGVETTRLVFVNKVEGIEDYGFRGHGNEFELLGGSEEEDVNITVPVIFTGAEHKYGNEQMMNCEELIEAGIPAGNDYVLRPVICEMQERNNNLLRFTKYDHELANTPVSSKHYLYYEYTFELVKEVGNISGFAGDIWRITFNEEDMGGIEIIVNSLEITEEKIIE